MDPTTVNAHSDYIAGLIVYGTLGVILLISVVGIFLLHANLRKADRAHALMEEGRTDEADKLYRELGWR
jgi:UPF0716 family protein affecting phage T7 exclusion